MKSLQNLSYKTLFAILFLSLAGIVFFLKIGNKTQKISAAWWDDMWHYRKAISITNSSGNNLTDFQVAVSIGTSQLIADGKMQLDCDDIRITDINGNLLPYWIETDTCNTDTTRIWLKINNLPISGSDPYIYYGNSSATSQSDSSILPKSCSNLNPFLGSGIYYIDPDQNKNTNPFQVYCDMTIDGGGWTLLSYTNNYSDLNFPPSIFTGYGTYDPNTSSGNASIGSSLLNYIDVYDLMATDLNNAQPYVPNGDIVYINNYTGGAKKPFGCLLSFPCGIACGSAQTSGLDLRGYSTSGAQEWSSNNICSSSYTTNQWSLGYSGGDWLNSTLTGIYLEYWTGGTPSSARRSAMIKGNNDTGVTHKIWVRETKPTNISYTASAQSEEIGTSPIAYWKFDESNGTTAYDSAGNNNGVFGASSSPPTWADESQCISGKCLSFDGTGSLSIDIPNNNTFNFGTNNFTISAWALNRDYAYPKSNFMIKKSVQCFASGASNAGFDIGHGYVANGIDICIRDVNNNSVRQNITFNNGYRPSQLINKWTHYVFVFNRTNGKILIYINGIKQNNELNISSVTGSISTNYPLMLGTLYGWQTDGIYDEIKIYPYARTPDQIKLDYNSRGSSSGAGVNLGIQSNTAPSLKSSLAAYYKFDESNGNIVYDSSGNNKNGSLGTGSSSPNWSKNGQSNGALNFDGNDSITLTNEIVSTSSIRTNGITYSAWIKPSNVSGTQKIVGQKPSSGYSDLASGGLDISSGKARMITYDDNIAYKYATSNTTLVPNQWYLITGVYNPSDQKIKIYVNGQFDGGETSITTFNRLLSNDYNLIGSYNYSSNFFNGLIDEVKIYNRALTPEEIKQDYNQGSAVQFGVTTQNIGGTTTSLEYCIPGDTSYCAPPIAEWKMDEGIGNSITDTSGNNYTSTFIGTPNWDQGKIGKSLTFNGSTDSVKLTGPTTSSQETLSAWIYIDSSSPNGDIVGNCHTNANQQYGFTFYLDGNLLRAKAATNGDTYFFDNIYYDISSLKNKWIHSSMVWNNLGTGTGGCDANVKLYINGQLVDEGTHNVSSGSYSCTAPYPYPFSMGGTATTSLTRTTKIKLDHIKVYNYARTPAQIAYDYNKGTPIRQWKFDECQGNIVYDWSDSTNHGTITIGSSGSQTSLGTCTVGSSAAWTNGANGKFNSSINLDGNDDYISIPSYTYTSNASISVWVKGSYADGNQIIIGSPNSIALGLYNSGSNKTLIGSASISKAVGISNNFIDNSWNHLVVVFNSSGDATYYCNGQLLSNSGTNNWSWSSGTYIGRRDTGNYFKGQIDQLEIYNYALTHEQIKQIYNGGSINFQ